VIQACGRVVRSPEDHGATYLADTSLLELFERARGDMPDWFADQVDRLSRPALPSFSATDALGADRTNRGFGRERSQHGTGAEDVEDHPLSDVWGE